MLFNIFTQLYGSVSYIKHTNCTVSIYRGTIEDTFRSTSGGVTCFQCRQGNKKKFDGILNRPKYQGLFVILDAYQFIWNQYPFERPHCNKNKYRGTSEDHPTSFVSLFY